MDLIIRLKSVPLLRLIKAKFTSLRTGHKSPARILAGKLEKIEAAIVFDIGANVGQFAIDLYSYGFKGHIFSFEPVEDAYKYLVKNSQRYSNWSTVNLALGSEPGMSIINVSANDYLSSSILLMKELHLVEFPKSHQIKTQTTSLSTVDLEILKLGIEKDITLLKIDVQGYELEVLKGAVVALSLTRYCLIEVSLISLYQGESTFADLIEFLKLHNHKVVDIFKGVKSKNGDLLQVDILTQNTLFGS